MYTVKFFENFQVLKRLRHEDTKTNYKSTLYQAAKKNDLIDSKRIEHLWYLKKLDNQDEINSLLEVVAQEFFRLILPRQPKTRIVINADKNEYFVTSREVTDFRAFENFDPKELNSKILSREFYGLGEIVILSLLLNENDLNGSNIGVDNSGGIIKIDGGWCFTRLSEDPNFENKNYVITEKDLELLPFVLDYEPYNWLDIVKGEVRYASLIISKELSSNVEFRREINDTILKIILLPNTMIETFVLAYYDDVDVAFMLSLELCWRRDQLLNAALENESFKNYLNSSVTKETLETFCQQLSEFKPARKKLLFGDVRSELTTRFEELQDIFQLQSNSNQGVTLNR
jgi:hypothetical protein